MTELDPILEARVDLLEQALAEVDKIRRAMSVQRTALTSIDDFLGRSGELADATRTITLRLKDTVNRLEVPWEDLDEEPPQAFERSGRDDGLTEALSMVRDALDRLTKLDQGRKSAEATFKGIRDWSVAGLADLQLGSAAAQYKRLVERIRTHAEPWRAYEQQLLGRGEELFTAYFELLSSMAVRGFGIDAEVTKDRNQLLTFLLSRTGPGQSVPSFPAPNLLTHTDHVQLGYSGWSLWVLPLIARDAALHMMSGNVFSTEIPEPYRRLCADVFSLYTLGPSYPCALIYLELDPENDSDETVSDLVRAEVLLGLLPELGTEVERPVLGKRALQLRRAWGKARAAFNDHRVDDPEADTVVVPAEAREVVNRFLDELRRSHYEVAFDPRSLVNVEEWLEHLLADPGLPLPEGTLPVRDLLIAMWTARLDQPQRCGEIHERAHELTARPTPPGPTGQARRFSR